MTINRFYILLTFLVIAISGNPAMGVLSTETVYSGTFMIFLALWWFKPLKLTGQDVLVLVSFSLLILAHVLSFGTMAVTASLGFFIRLSIALLAIRLIPEFPRRYVSVMYALSIISFIFFIPLLGGLDMKGLFAAIRVPLPLDSIHYHIGIYNLRDGDGGSIRNTGMFWEPGAFAGYLILALFFLIRGGPTEDVSSKQGLVLIAALLSTQSTTGYLAFMVLVIYYVCNSAWSKGMVAKLLVLPVFLLVLVWGAKAVMNEVSFLGEKINATIESASVGDDASRLNRLGNFLYDLEWIANRPVLGWSATPATRVSIDAEVDDLGSGQGNGLTGFTIKFGLVGLFIFIGFFAYTTRRITGSLSASLLGVVIVCMLLMGEQFLGFPMFLSLMFLPQNKLRPLTASHMADIRKLRFAGRGTGRRV